MKSLLALGEAMVELADAGDGLYRRGFAGDTFNTAWYARQLLPADWRVSYGSCIGSDAISQEFSDFASSAGIDISSLRQLKDRTLGLYMISLTGSGERRFAYWRDHSAARLLAEDADWLAQITKDRDFIYFSGITLAILQPNGRAALCEALQQARRQGTRVAFDTNLRPSLWQDRAAMQEGMQMGAGAADIVLPSFDEDSWLFGDRSPDETLARYRRCGATTIAVKNGGNALTLYSAEGRHELPVLPVHNVVDTTAAGDSFAAGFLAGLARGDLPEQAARKAMELAAKVIQSRGALVPQIFQGARP